MTSVCILDYGGGNIKSVYNMFSILGVDVVISKSEEDISNASHLVLPGVGAFGAVMEKIRKELPVALIEKQVLENKKPFLGICVGMQVLATIGNEFGEHQGLNWIPGRVDKLEVETLALPHVGWNTVNFALESKFTDSLNDSPDFYFVHSNCFTADNEAHAIGKTNYEVEFTSVVQKENIYGVQFHPEKSQIFGKKVMQNFLSVQ